MKNNLVRAIQCLESKYGPVTFESDSDVLYLILTKPAFIPKARLNRLASLGIYFDEEDLDWVDDPVAVTGFTFYL